MDIAGTTVLLTGATGGLGHAIARRLAKDGANLVLSGRQAGALEQLVDEVGGRVITADLADPAAVPALAEAAGAVDILVANAALPASGRILEFDTDRIDRCLQVNLHAPINLARLLLPSMVEQGEGHLLFVSSVSGIASTAGSSMYAATKFGLRGFAFGARGDLHGTGVGVSVVSPGFVRDLGMFADAGVTLPPGTRTTTSAKVADAVVRAVTRDRAEIVVAPPEMHVGAKLSGLAPGLGLTITRMLGGDKVADDMAAGQLDKR